MANKSKAKGTRAETRLVNYLVKAKLDARRQALHGNTDHGDVLVRLMDGDVCTEELVIEVKAGEQTANYNRSTKEEWLRQTCEEVRNAKVRRGFLVVARHRRSIDDWEVWSADGHSFWFLNHFPNHLKNTVRKAKNEKHQALPGHP
ncbi:hypothetical protein [uncultured Bifidobacterium sp.]|uniref:hypothetical protein n=1 Tax=uncultured Bifidobacterium sp. TaxID=165187 RepID=UPI00260CE406|nr:hypothetical protein [uncultured Bifidobacterium sp.]